jgi:hypothetical protein
VRPQHLVREPEALTVGGTRFVLYPARGGETADALLIHVPDRGALFVGDAFIRSLLPRVLVHGHPPLTDIFTAEALPAIESALQELHERVRTGVREGRTLAEVLHGNILPTSLREHPAGVVPYLVMRDSLHNLPDFKRIRQIYREFRMHLKLGGVFLNADLINAPTVGLRRRYDGVAAGRSRREGGSARDLDALVRYGRRSPARSGREPFPATLEEHLAALQAGGFKDVDCFWKELRQAVFGGHAR